MESIIRDVKNLDSNERQVYELAVGHALQDDQRVMLTIIGPGAEPDELRRRQAREEFLDLCRKGSENRQRQGISISQADQILEEAVRAIRTETTK